VFENRKLSRILKSKEEEVKVTWIELHDEELHNLYSLQNVIRMIKSRRVRWTGHIARMGEN
jgi:hypothetical protein